MDHLERAIVWRNLLTGGTEYFELRQKRDYHLLRGKVVSIQEPAQPLFVSYEIVCDKEWRTHEAQILQVNAGEQCELNVKVTGVDWSINGKLRPDLHGLLDIDLSITPSTNTLPLRRLNLQGGQSQPVTAAWIRFPSLELAP
ncbi:MAG TPA: putative glycolipid-binding domain-containing protein, partial [Terriglobales bacterium]|nr:putative glycolipid-binding domain-containing protein [Terriglobales bacterium]